MKNKQPIWVPRMRRSGNKLGACGLDLVQGIYVFAETRVVTCNRCTLKLIEGLKPPTYVCKDLSEAKEKAEEYWGMRN